jgi:hypothetical protein
MMDKSTKKHVAQMDGQLQCKIGEDENIFVGRRSIKRLEDELELARAMDESDRKENILESFRDAVGQFETEFGFKPTVALLCYTDKNCLAYAFDKECMMNKVPTTYGRVDGIKIKSGCDQTLGDVQLRTTNEVTT